jgi:hypothetical protein
MLINFEWIFGLAFGVEYTTLDDFDYLVFDLGVFRIVLIKDMLQE